jgi:ubiquinone/menaquinone biosynthesis C-methylase UbiE
MPRVVLQDILPQSPHYWQDLWKQKKRALYLTPGFEQSGTYWNNRKNVTCLYIRSRTRTAWQENLDAQLNAMQIPAGARVLDIGGGTGTLAIPLVARGSNVTVIEPSGAMREELEKNMASSGKGTAIIIPKRWEDISLDELGDPFDTVIASYSLSMTDIGEALKKMQACFPILGASQQGSMALTPWKRNSGEPLADCLWQVLYEMGIYANLTTERKKTTIYRTKDEVVQEYYQRLKCSEKSQETILKEYFTRELRSSRGGFFLNGASYSAHLWWNTGA